MTRTPLFAACLSTLLIAGCASNRADYGPGEATQYYQPVRSSFFNVPEPAVLARQLSGQIGQRDYPRDARSRRSEGEVAVVLLIGRDGLVRDCRVDRSSGDRDLDDATCALATQRFRYEPALNAYREPVEDVAGWVQRWSL